jgi:hypothetical protein
MGIGESSTLKPPEQNGETRGDILIAHTNEEGTLVSGTSRGDGSRDALRVAGFRWSRNLGVWYMRQSRGFAARRERIDTLATALRTAGFTVTVDIEEYDAGSAFQARQNASEERADTHAQRATREKGRSTQRHQAAHAAVAFIPPEQPILVGHHSEARHRRDLDRHDRNMRKAIEHGENADRAERRSDSARSQAAARESPVVMGRKIARLEAEQRKIPRLLLTHKGEYAEQLRERLHVVEEDLAFLRGEMERSGARVYTRADIQKGDLVQLRGRWELVVKANPKTVAVKTPYSWTDTQPYHEITDHRRPAGAEGQMMNAEC